MEHETASGLTVVTRAVLPRDLEPNLGGDGPNSPPVSVGPTSSTGFGNTNVLYNANAPAPPGVNAWSGWPVDWYAPNWTPQQGWLGSRIGTVGTCCDTIGRTCSELVPVVMRGTETVDPQPGWTTNPEPLLYASWDEWQRGCVNSLLLRGETFLIATQRNAEGFPVRWVTLNPDHVEVDLVTGRLVYRFEGDSTPFPDGDVLHIKYQQTPGNLRGIGPIHWTGLNFVTAESLAMYVKNLADNGGVPWAYLSHPGHPNADQVANLRDQWNTAAPLRRGAPAILSAGMTLNTISLNPEQMALLSLREFDEQRIAAAFGVPPSYVGLPQPSGLNYTTSQMIADFFYRSTLRPMSKNIAAAISGWALPRGTNLVMDASDFLAPLESTPRTDPVGVTQTPMASPPAPTMEAAP
jgi:HK97 family phage portal protein